MSFDLDQVELNNDEDGLDALDLSGFGEVDIVCNDPHIKLPTREFASFLKIARQMSSSSGRDVVSRSIMISAEEGKVYLRATDYDSYLSMSCELLNLENVLTTPIVISMEIASKLIGACPSVTVFSMKPSASEGSAGSYYLHLVGGEMSLETFSVSPEKFKCVYDTELLHTNTGESVFTMLKNFSPVISSSLNSNERRIFGSGGSTYAFHLPALVQSPTSLGDIDIRLKDIAVLKPLLSGETHEIRVSRTDKSSPEDRALISSDNFEYWFLISSVQLPQVFIASMSEVLTPEYIYIDLLQFYKMINVAAELTYSTGRVGLNVTENGEIILSIKTRKQEDSIFHIPGAFSGNMLPLEKELVVQAKALKLLARSFGQSVGVQVTMTPMGIGIRSDSHSAVLFSETD